MSWRYEQRSHSERTVEWDSLPPVRARNVFRARVWRAVIAGLLLFWVAFAWLAFG